MDAQKLLISLGKVIRAKRSELGYSQEEFAEAVGLHRTYIGSIERAERNISFQNLVKIAQALSLKPSNLLLTAEKKL